MDLIFVAVILYIFYKMNDGPKLSFSIKKGKQLLKVSHNYIWAGLITAIYGATDKFMLKQYMGEETVGYYSLAVSISTIWVFALSAIIESYSPTIIAQFKTNKNFYIKSNKRLYAIIFYTSMLVSLAICLIAPLLIKILYGEEYLPAVSPLRVVVWYVAFAYLGVARQSWIVCEDKQKYIKYIYLGSAVMNVILNAWLIPKLGAVGAAIASVAAEVSGILVFPLIIKPLRPNLKLLVDGIRFKGVIK